jgi:hypothetical protein
MENKNNREFQKLIKEDDNVKYIKARRMNWWRHPSRMQYIKLIQQITDWAPVGVRTN